MYEKLLDIADVKVDFGRVLQGIQLQVTIAAIPVSQFTKNSKTSTKY